MYVRVRMYVRLYVRVRTDMLLFNPYSTVPHVAITGNVVIIVNKIG